MTSQVPLLASGPRSVAVVALLLYVVGVVTAFGGRAWLQAHRTGDWGVRRVSPDQPPAGRLGAALFGVSLLLEALGLAAGVLAPTWRLLQPGALTWVGLGVCVVGLAAVVASQVSMGASWRVGVDPQERTELMTHGMFGLVRNPIFTAMGVALVGLALMVPNVVTVAALLIFCVGVQLQVRIVEERYLERIHGDAYRDYARRIGRFIPGVGTREW